MQTDTSEAGLRGKLELFRKICPIALNSNTRSKKQMSSF